MTSSEKCVSSGGTCLFGEYAISKKSGPLSVVRVFYVPDIDINIKAEACNIHCEMLRFATWSRIAGERV